MKTLIISYFFLSIFFYDYIETTYKRDFVEKRKLKVFKLDEFRQGDFLDPSFFDYAEIIKKGINDKVLLAFHYNSSAGYISSCMIVETYDSITILFGDGLFAKKNISSIHTLDNNISYIHLPEQHGREVYISNGEDSILVPSKRHLIEDAEKIKKFISSGDPFEN